MIALPPPIPARIAAAQQTWLADNTRWHGRATLGQTLAAGLRAHPHDRLIFTSLERPAELSLADMQARGETVADALFSLGLRRGDVLVAQVPQWAEQVMLWYAAAQIGLVYVPVVHIYEASELSYILRDSRAKVLIVPDRWRSIDYCARVGALEPLSHLEHIVVIGESAPAGCLLWDELLERTAADGSSSGRKPDPEMRTTDPCLLLYTSGTTSRPKGVVHTNDTFLAECWTSFQTLYRGPTSVTLDVSPAGHMAGVIGMMRPLITNANVTLFTDAWKAERALEFIQRYRVTSCGGPPYFLSTLLDAAEANGGGVETIADWMLGGSAVPPHIALRAEEAGFTTYRCYGSTEHPTISTGWLTDAVSERTTTDGHLLDGTFVRVVDEDGQNVVPGEEGEILCVGPEQMAGYTDFTANAEAFDESGYFRTGDLGVLFPNGLLQVTGRKKDIIIRGGENLSAVEIEEILLRHEAVHEAAAVAIPDEIYTERVCVVVALNPNASLTLDDIRQYFATAGVARHKTPERLVVLPELPHTATGKINKQELRAAVRRAQPGDTVSTK